MREYVYRQEINLTEIADEYAKRIQERVDEIALDKASGTLAKYGYVKTIRCRDCANYSGENDEIYPRWCMAMNVDGIEPDGYCSWAVRRDEWPTTS